MSGGGGDSTIKMEPDAQTQAYRQKIQEAALAAAAQPYQGYAGPTTAGVSDLTEQAIQSQQGQLGQGQSAWNQGQQLTNMGLPGGAQQYMNPYLEQTNPYWKQAMDKAVSASGSAMTAPGGGAFGGSRAAVAAGEAASGVANAQAMQNVGAYQNAQQNAMQAAGMGQGMMNLGLGAQGNAQRGLYGAGDYMRNIQQQAINGQMQQFQNAQNWDLRGLGILTGAPGLFGGQGGNTQTQHQPGQDWMSGLLGMGLTAGSFFI